MIRLMYLCMLALTEVLFLAACSPAGFESALKEYEAHRFTTAFQKFIDLGRDGDRRAQFYVGRMLHLGEGVSQDKFAAMLWYRKSVVQGFDRAQNNLGVLYLEQGRYEEARELFRQAAAHGLPQAAENLKNFDHLIPQAIARRSQAGGGTVPASPDLGVHFNRLKPGL